MAAVKGYMVGCDHCGFVQFVPGPRRDDAERELRARGWAAHHHRYACPQHRMTTAQAAENGRRALSAQAAGRLEDYQELRSWGLTRRQAAARLGICLKTTDRYEAKLRASREAAA